MRETWHCFGCGLGGDIFSFVMQRDGVDVPGGAPDAGRARPASRSTSGPSARTPTRRGSASVLDSAIAFYHAVLTGSKAGEPALDYLRGRGFTDETIETLPARLGARRLGPDDAGTLATKRDVRPEELVEVGLASPAPAAGGGVYDQFRARVIFPIRDQNGHAVGLGGRLLEGDGPEVPELPGDAAVRQEPDAVPDRQGQGPDPQDRARPSSSRATPTR